MILIYQVHIHLIKNDYLEDGTWAYGDESYPIWSMIQT